MKAHIFKRDREFGVMLMKKEMRLMDRSDVKRAFKCMILIEFFFSIIMYCIYLCWWLFFRTYLIGNYTLWTILFSDCFFLIVYKHD